MKAFIIGFILGMAQGAILLDYYRDKQNLHAIIKEEKK